MNYADLKNQRSEYDFIPLPANYLRKTYPAEEVALNSAELNAVFADMREWDSYKALDDMSRLAIEIKMCEHLSEAMKAELEAHIHRDDLCGDDPYDVLRETMEGADEFLYQELSPLMEEKYKALKQVSIDNFGNDPDDWD